MSKKEQEQEKRTLINFIEWKLRYDKDFLKEILPELKSMNLMELTRWAIRNDIIDA